MCGIVGLHLRNPELYPRLGELLTGMLCEMEDRGADSAGIAVYGDPDWSPAGRGALSLIDVGVTPQEVAGRLGEVLDVEVSTLAVDGIVLVNANIASGQLLQAARREFPGVLVGGFGADLAVLKGVGSPRQLAEDWGLSKVQGWQGVGHTRMATESAVTPSGAHPYAVGPEQCLVHNGSFSNHASIRRDLKAAGIAFDSENDTEGRCPLRGARTRRWQGHRDRTHRAHADLRWLLHAARVQP
jgi:glutamate synthase domain-containing protein 1